jgi:hypothetical protein
VRHKRAAPEPPHATVAPAWALAQSAAAPSSSAQPEAAQAGLALTTQAQLLLRVRRNPAHRKTMLRQYLAKYAIWRKEELLDGLGFAANAWTKSQ